MGTTGVNNGAGVDITGIHFSDALMSGTEYSMYCATNDTTRVLSKRITHYTTGFVIPPVVTQAKANSFFISATPAYAKYIKCMALGMPKNVIDDGSSNNTNANNDGKIVVSNTDAEFLGL